MAETLEGKGLARKNQVESEVVEREEREGSLQNTGRA